MVGAALLGGCRERAAVREHDVAEWFEGGAADLPEECQRESAAGEPVELRVELYAAPGVDVALARRQLIALRERAAGFGVRLRPGTGQLRIDAPPVLLSITRADMTRELGARPPPDAAERLLIRPVGDFLRTRAGQPLDRINVVFVREIAAPSSALAARLHAVSGLTFSPQTGATAEGAELSRLLGVERYRPTIFAAEARLAHMADSDAADTLLHELGHAFGLEHTEAPDNLMSQQRAAACAAAFDPTQLDSMRAGVRRLGAER